jgi:hypothetical protein
MTREMPGMTRSFDKLRMTEREPGMTREMPGITII